MKTLLLTSAGTDVRDEIINILPKPASKLKLAQIKTASKVEPDTAYIEKDRQNFENMGFMVEDVDIEGKTETELREHLKQFDIVVVQGGNTFYLLKAVQDSGFDKVIKSLISKGTIYIGISAGTVICCPTIETSGWKSGDKNIVGLKNLAGLDLVPFNIFVHYNPKYDEIIRDNASKSKIKTRILTDDQAFLIKGSKITLVGEKPEVLL